MEELKDSSGLASVELEEASSCSVKDGENEMEGVELTEEDRILLLKSVETKCVNQLYRSLDLIGRRSCEPESPKHKRTCNDAPSDQFKVFRNGRWSRIYFTRDQPQFSQQVENPESVFRNPWIQRYTKRSSKKRAVRKSPVSEPKVPFPSTVNQNPPHNFQFSGKDCTDFNSEGTNQNFKDGDDGEEKPFRTFEIKKMKISSDVFILSTVPVIA